jgi:hypothetical protein
MFNTHSNAINSRYINLDELLFDLKILPEKLEIPIPRYALELDRKNMAIRD